METQTKKFTCGHDVPEDFDQENIELIGQVTDLTQLDTVSYDAETTNLYPGVEIYYYYEEKTFKFISDGTPPKARFQNKCEACLLESLTTEEPHYGDGVYFSQHKQLFHMETHEETVRSHGIPLREYRATYICLNEAVFKKIKKTGGVLRSRKHIVENINDQKLVSISEGVVYPLCIGW
ncbi:hypothetical protein V7111_21990 [Neobacillus niacini]|uniref:hypothetical protein n=1 Tax=Neobacillus niacini TaxID=86668 RepID=UPI0030020B8D